MAWTGLPMPYVHCSLEYIYTLNAISIRFDATMLCNVVDFFFKKNRREQVHQQRSQIKEEDFSNLLADSLFSLGYSHLPESSSFRRGNKLQADKRVLGRNRIAGVYRYNVGWCRVGRAFLPVLFSHSFFSRKLNGNTRRQHRPDCLRIRFSLRQVDWHDP